MLAQTTLTHMHSGFLQGFWPPARPATSSVSYVPIAIYLLRRPSNPNPIDPSLSFPLARQNALLKTRYAEEDDTHIVKQARTLETALKTTSWALRTTAKICARRSVNACGCADKSHVRFVAMALHSIIYFFLRGSELILIIHRARQVG